MQPTACKPSETLFVYRLDKSLTIGQMQGKFQLVLMPTAGHAIQVGSRGLSASAETATRSLARQAVSDYTYRLV